MRDLMCLVSLSLGVFAPVPGLALGTEPFRYKAGEHKTGRVKGELKDADGIPVLVVQGSPEQMGEQIGVLGVRQAKPLFNFPRDYFREESADSILRANPKWANRDNEFKEAIANAEAVFWPLVQKKAVSLEDNFPDAHRTELRAIADAAGRNGVSYDQLVAGNALFDLEHVSPGELLLGCSSVIIPPKHSKTKGLLFGRNLDFPHFGYLHQYSLLTVYRSNDPKRKHSFASAGFPGFVGCFTGMNDAGLTIASHEVDQPGATTLFNPKGVPFAMAYRRVLEECATVGDALKLLDGMERASVTSLVIADPEGGAVIEVTPDALTVRRFKDMPGVCTNHFCVMKNPKQTDSFRTLERYDTLTKSVAVKEDQAFDIGDIHRRLHDVRLFDGHNAEITIQTFVFEPAARRVHLSFGDGTVPATAGKLRTLDLNKLWGN